MAEKENPNYYAIIPANVRYCKEIPANAKLLYGEITALCNQKGYCWASNNYFADLYEVTPQAISKWINQLAKKGYITLDYERAGKEIKQRNIYIATYQQIIKEVSIKDDGGINKRLRGYQQKIKENTTVNNTTNNTNIPSKQEIQIQEQFLIFYQNYPKKVDKTDSKKVFTSLLKKGIKLDYILSKLKIYEKQIKQNNTELKYIRSPARFLRTMDDYEDTEIKKRDIIKQYCKKCGEILLDGTCSKCYALHDIEGELI